MTPDDIYKRSSHHRTLLLASELCGCFHCQTVFNVAEITEWVDGNDTALCPQCHIDAVIPVVEGEDLLAIMNKEYFTRHNE